MPVILSLIPTIFGFLLNHLGNVVSDVSRSNITSGILALGKSVTSSGIMGVIEKELGQIESEKRALIEGQVQILLAQADIIKEEIKSPKAWYEIPHAVLEMGADVYLMTGFFLGAIHMIAFSLGHDFPLSGYSDLTVGIALTASGLVKTYKALT